MEAVNNPNRRIMVGGGVLALMLAGSGLTKIASAAAQEATPAPLEFPLGPGVTAELIEAPDDNPALIRVQIAAGATWEASDGSDPAISLIYAESGSVAVLTAAAVTVFRADAAGKPGEPIAASTEFVVNPGDYFVGAPQAAASVRNDGATPATWLMANLVPPTAGA
ncbi:hypothetical protein BH09CHL1_BH09CHL1_23330 [soil metagenome]